MSQQKKLSGNQVHWALSQQMAAWPKEKTATNTSGLYCMGWNLEERE
ncbi:hypothetical protein [Candidatus Neptunichlamydia sp. REUL1]|nr:hypothetical protein [Candidatus Neptunochlamydia sp. REUL1]